MKIIIAVAFYLLYWFCCFLGTGTDKKNLLGLRSYPDEVQHLDYTMSEAGGATKFVRQYTIANGDAYCDCGYKKI